MDWFRLYGEFATDPKVQMMDESMQRRLVMLMCIQCGAGIETFHETERASSIAFTMRISEEELEATRVVFVNKGFINEDWTLRNWSKRQYTSDSSTARVRAHRERKKQEAKHNETLHGCSSNAPEQNRAEQNRSEEKHMSLSGDPLGDTSDDGFAEFWKQYPRKAAKPAAQKAWKKLKPSSQTLSGLMAALDRQKDSPEWLKDGGQFIPHPATWLNGRRWEDETPPTTAARAGNPGHADDGCRFVN